MRDAGTKTATPTGAGLAPCGAPLDLLGASLKDDLGWLLMRASRGMSAVVAAALESLSLDRRAAVVLKTISACSAPTQLAIAQVADIDKTTLVAVLDDLEQKGFLSRSPDPNDRRARVVQLTDDGRRVVAWFEAAIGDIERSLLDTLDTTDREALLRTLPKLITALDRAAAGEEI